MGQDGLPLAIALLAAGAILAAAAAVGAIVVATLAAGVPGT